MLHRRAGSCWRSTGLGWHCPWHGCAQKPLAGHGALPGLPCCSHEPAAVLRRSAAPSFLLCKNRGRKGAQTLTLQH